MGQDQSSTQQFKNKPNQMPLLSQMKLLNSGNDIRYGDIKVMQTESGMMVAVKTHVSQDQEVFEQFRKLNQAQLSGSDSDPYLIRLLDMQHNSQQEMCGFHDRTSCVYEYYQHDLRKDMEELQHTQRRYEEIEIVAMMHCVLGGLVYLQMKKQNHGDLRPETILMTSPSLNNPLKVSNVIQPAVFKLTRIQEMTQMNAYKRCLSNLVEQTLKLSPEQLNSLLTNSIKPKYDPYKSDVFTLALVALEMATLNDLQDIYDQDKYQIVTDTLDNHLHQLSNTYSPQLSSIIESMLNFTPEQRPDLMMAQANLRPYQFQLEDYFRDQKIYEPYTGKPQQPQQPPKPLQPIQPQYPQQPQQPKYDAVALLKHVQEIDNKVRQALFKSQEVQQRCQNSSPGRTFHSNSSRVTGNLDNYQQLSQITLAQVQLSPSRLESIIQHPNGQSQRNSMERYYQEVHDIERKPREQPREQSKWVDDQSKNMDHRMNYSRSPSLKFQSNGNANPTQQAKNPIQSNNFEQVKPLNEFARQNPNFNNMNIMPQRDRMDSQMESHHSPLTTQKSYQYKPLGNQQQFVNQQQLRDSVSHKDESPNRNSQSPQRNSNSPDKNNNHQQMNEILNIRPMAPVLPNKQQASQRSSVANSQFQTTSHRPTTGSNANTGNSKVLAKNNISSKSNKDLNKKVESDPKKSTTKTQVSKVKSQFKR